MQIKKSKKGEANSSTQISKDRYTESVDYIKAAIDSLSRIASDDEIARDALADLSVVLLSLK